MKKLPRLLLMAIIALALSVLCLSISVVGSTSIRPQFYRIEPGFTEIATSGATPQEFQRWINDLPRPLLWESYSVITMERSTDGRWASGIIAQAHKGDTGLSRLLQKLRLIRFDQDGTFDVPNGPVQYRFYYSYGVPGSLFELGIVAWFLLFWLCLALWVYQDAKERQVKQALPWLGLGLFGGPVAVAIWLIQRPAAPPPAPVCPVCATQQVEDATYCVNCGVHLKPTCQECGRAIQPSWKHCPTCGNHLAEESA